MSSHAVRGNPDLSLFWLSKHSNADAFDAYLGTTQYLNVRSATTDNI